MNPSGNQIEEAHNGCSRGLGNKRIQVRNVSIVISGLPVIFLHIIWLIYDFCKKKKKLFPGSLILNF